MEQAKQAGRNVRSIEAFSWQNFVRLPKCRVKAVLRRHAVYACVLCVGSNGCCSLNFNKGENCISFLYDILDCACLCLLKIVF